MTSELDRSKEKKHSPTDLQDQLRPSIGGIDNLGLKQRDIVDDLNNMLAHIFIESMEISQNDKTLKSNCANYQEVNSHCLLNRSIAHDLNNLLAHLNLSAELLREALPWDNAQFSKIVTLCQGVKLVTKLARRLTEFEIDNVYQNQLVNLNQLLLKLLKFLQYGVMENIEIKTFLSPSLKLVEVDPTQFELVIVNLTTNAIEAMPKGGKLTIETMNVTLDEKNVRENVILRPGSYVTTTVSDTGYGMDSKILNHLFEPFFTTKKNRMAKGLGLTIVSRVIKQYGGDISVSTKLDKGTAFKIYLPSYGWMRLDPQRRGIGLASIKQFAFFIN